MKKHCELMHLEDSIKKSEVGVVVTLEASTISGNLDIFREFMAICEEHGVQVFSLEWWKHDNDAEEQYCLFKEFRKRRQ